jgi:hypothetical protein
LFDFSSSDEKYDNSSSKGSGGVGGRNNNNNTDSANTSSSGSGGLLVSPRRRDSTGDLPLPAPGPISSPLSSPVLQRRDGGKQPVSTTTPALPLLNSAASKHGGGGMDPPSLSLTASPSREKVPVLFSSKDRFFEKEEKEKGLKGKSSPLSPRSAGLQLFRSSMTVFPSSGGGGDNNRPATSREINFEKEKEKFAQQEKETISSLERQKRNLMEDVYKLSQEAGSLSKTVEKLQTKKSKLINICTKLDEERKMFVLRSGKITPPHPHSPLLSLMSSSPSPGSALKKKSKKDEKVSLSSLVSFSGSGNESSGNSSGGSGSGGQFGGGSSSPLSGSGGVGALAGGGSGGQFGGTGGLVCGGGVTVEFGKQLSLIPGRSGAMVFTCYINGWECAAKQIDLLGARPAKVEALQREIDILANIPPHPNVVRYLGHESSATKQTLYLSKYDCTLRLILDEQRKKGERYAPILIARYASEVLCGLQYLHSLAIMHRDIKADNVFVRVSNTNQIAKLVIGDFDTGESHPSFSFFKGQPITNKQTNNQQNELQHRPGRLHL